MKTAINFVYVALLAMIVTSCYRVKPDAGEESVLVKKPMFFGHGGVEPEPISTGATWCVWTTDHKEFSITPKTISEHFQDMIPSDQTPVSFDAYIKVQIISGKTPDLYSKFGENWYSNNMRATFRTLVRDYASEYTMYELSSKRKITSLLEKKIHKDMVAYVKRIKLPIRVIQVSIGSITPPRQVLDETKSTSAQNQSILTQKARAKAEMARMDAEVQKAIADKAYQNQMNMTIDEYLRLRQLEIEKEKVELIKDNKNTTIIFGGANNPVALPIKK